MPIAIFNIGLKLSSGALLDSGDALGYLRNELGLSATGPFQSDTEPTIVAEGLCGDPAYVAGYLAEHFYQDAVAYYDPIGKTGGLAGPKAEDWGEFAPSLFILPDGTRAG